MRKTIVLCLFMCVLYGCNSVEPSKAITECIISDVKHVDVSINNLEKTTKTECKTDAFNVSISSIKGQVSSIAGQIKNISTACESEKNVLKEQINTRDVVIIAMSLMFLLILFVFIKRKIFS